MSLSCPTAKSQRKRTTGAPIWPTPALPPRSFHPEPPDPESTRKIRLSLHPIRAIRSRSKHPDAKIPVRPGSFAKEPLHFSRINPHSKSVLKYLQFGPETCTDPPGFSQNRTRHPGLVFLRVRPQSFSLIMF